MIELMAALHDPHRQPAVEWLTAHGCTEGHGVLLLEWPSRSGRDFLHVQFHPLQRHPLDLGWNVVVGNRGELPHVVIGCCDTLAEVQLIYATLQQLNGAAALAPHPARTEEREP